MTLDELKREGKRLRRRIKELEEAIAKVEAEMLEIQKKIPNMTHPDAPITRRKI